MNKLEEILLEEHGLELIDKDVKTVRSVIKSIKHSIGESYHGVKDSIVLGMEELEEFETYNCLIAVSADGAMCGMKYVIVDGDLRLIGFVRII